MPVWLPHAALIPIYWDLAWPVRLPLPIIPGINDRDVSLRWIRVYAGEHVLADQGYDAQEFRQHILELGMMPVIPPRSNRKAPADYDRHLYRERHLVECFINKIKHYRRIFSRFEKLDTRYLGFLHFTAALIWLR